MTWFVQINDTHIRQPLKAAYQQEEKKRMINKLRKNRNRVTSTSIKEMMQLIKNACETLDLDIVKSSKYLWVTNALDNSEDY